MKRLISIILLIVFIFNLFGYLLVFFVIKSKIRSEIENQIINYSSKCNFTLFTFTDYQNLPDWFDEKEFIFNGKMYDVVKFRKSGNIITYYCVNDTNEDVLIEELSKTIDYQFDIKNLKNSSILLLLKKLSNEFVTNVKQTCLLASFDYLDFNYIPIIYHSPFLKLNVPPPKFA